jgi:hypothetical protein
VNDDETCVFSRDFLEFGVELPLSIDDGSLEALSFGFRESPNRTDRAGKNGAHGRDDRRVPP